MTLDDGDFLAMVKESSPTLAVYVAAKLRRGMHPRDITTQLRAEADRMRGWCTGRFGQ